MWCSPALGREVDEDVVRSAVRVAMALALASTVACSVFRASVRDSTEALRSEASPIAAEQDVMAGGLGGGGVAAAGGEDEREGEDLLERDTKLSRASKPRVAGPRLRSS